MELNQLSQKDLIELEVNRLAAKYNKDFLDCEDVQKITGLGRDNVRTLFKNKNFPTTKVGRRYVVSLINFVTWQITNN